MLKYDTEEKRMMIAGSGAEITADVIALVTRVCNSITHSNVKDCRAMMHVFARMIDRAADNDGLFEVLAQEMKSTTTVDLSHLMNNREESDE